MKKITLAGGLLSVGCALAAQRAEFRTTTFAERWRDASASVESAKAADADLRLDLASMDQTVLGFGVCASELSWNSLSALSEADRKSILDEMFSKDGGAFSVIRTPIGASDFATDFYSYSETPGDFAMEKFSIERDRKALLPLLKDILSRNDGTFKVWASPWCPPLWMKKSGAYASKPQTDPTWPKNDCSPEQRVREGEDGFLCDDAHFAAYAKYFRKYVDAYRAEGVPVWMVMPQNEFNSDQVFPSCTWQAKSLATFVGKYLGPALEGSGTELYFGTMERPSLEMARTILDDPDCRRYVKGAGFQWAGKGAIGKVREMYPGLTLVQTEQECGDGRNDWRNARHSWELMRHYFRCGVSYYCYWNLSLVDNALSRWGWRQNSLVSVVPSERSFAWNVEYHVLKQLSHYVRRGARRLKTAEGDWLAFVNPDGSVVVAFGNAGPARKATVAIGEKAWTVQLPADSVSTLILPPGGLRHAGNPVYPTYDGRVMAGYQGWFHNRSGGVMYPNEESVRIDMWPDVSEYEKTYPTGLKLSNGEGARFFCSDDESTVETHFRWMEEYGLDGVFLQRFFGNATKKTKEAREESATVIRHSLKAAQRHSRAISIMYDLSGLKPGRDDCMKLVDDWKFLVDEVKVTNYGERNMYLHHRGRPLVVIWGVGFPDRPYSIRDIKLAEFMDFLRNDPEYGGCSVMLGVPTNWRVLDHDCVKDDYLHELIRKADLVMPWMVGRFNSRSKDVMSRYRDIVEKDVEWCRAAGVDYVPLVYPGFSWYNLSRKEKGLTPSPVEVIPRQGGKFYWGLIENAVASGAKSLYVAMFDEVNEGTAIFKVSDAPPVGETVQFAKMDGQPSDHYLFLTGEAGRLLRGERKPLPAGEIPVRTFRYEGNPFATHFYYADPSAHVWNGRLYVYPSHDIDPPRGCDLMDRYHVLSTDDMVNWIDHGEFMRASDVEWGRPEGGFMWAPDCAYRDGKYYFYFPHPSLSRWNDSWLIGVAVSDRPDGGFKNVGTIPGLGGFAMIDPCVFTDFDGKSYIYAGGGAKMVGAKLKDNMVELDGEAKPMEGMEDFHEGPWVFRRGDWYYLMYPDNHEEPGVGGQNRQHYCMSRNPLGPWEHKGIILESTGCDTSHGSIVEYKGQWYMFYHNRVLSGRGNLRTLCYDKLYFNDDGTIQPVKQTRRDRQAFWKGK